MPLPCHRRPRRRVDLQRKSNEELDLLLAWRPVFNYAHYQVLPLADMATAATVLGSRKS